jgi:acyl-CoA reductase-like NAD-dependent aldehyde dehydrogenase
MQPQLADAVDHVRSRLGRRYPLIIGDREDQGREILVSLDPSDPSRVIGDVSLGDASHADGAVRAAAAMAPVWSRVPAEERATLLLRVADELARRRAELIAWMAFETGKSFSEADGEMIETIRHLAWIADRLTAARTVRWASLHADYVVEENDRPLGVGVALTPFSFPVALPVGIAAAAIGAGNTLVVKPSRVAPITAIEALRAFRAVGLPPGVLNIVVGQDESLRESLVHHSLTRFVAFVGSRTGGASVQAQAALWQPEQEQARHVIARTDGKAATLVTASADLDWAAKEVVRSAFAFQGQKCTSTAHLVLVDEIHDEFVDRLLAEVDNYCVDRGPATAGHRYGPMISAAALHKVRGFAHQAASYGMVLRHGDANGPGHFIGPVVVDDVYSDTPLEREEIFGPFLSIVRAGTLEHAIDVASGSGTAPAAAAFTRDAQEAARIRERLKTRTLYLNAASTGSLAGVRPPTADGQNHHEPDDPAAFRETRTIMERYSFPH